MTNIIDVYHQIKLLYETMSIQKQKNLYILVGFSGSTKTQYLYQFIQNNKFTDFQIFSNDTNKSDFDKFLKNQSITCQSTFIDNTNLTTDIRSKLIHIGQQNNVNIIGLYLQSSFEDCQIRVLLRMYQKFNELPLNNDQIRDLKKTHTDFNNDLLPISALFKQRKIFEQPSIDEGFTQIFNIQTEPITWDPQIFKYKCLFLDIDGTIRDTSNLEKKYPLNVSQVKLLFNQQQMKDKLTKYIQDGYLIIGISNQSGVSRNIISLDTAQSCFDQTINLLGFSQDQFPIFFCPHKPFPIQCYCRKPQIGLGIQAILQYKISPSQSLMVGDQTSDKTFADKLSIKFIKTNDFWKDI